MITTRKLALMLALAATGVTPAVAVAKQGADDPAGDDRGVQSSDNSSSSSGGGSKARAKTVTGSCTGSSTAKLKAKPDDGKLETEFEVDRNRNGERWTVVVRRNGRVAISTSATTHAPSGSFSVERRIANPAGTDRITARATSPRGEACTATLSI